MHHLIALWLTFAALGSATYAGDASISEPAGPVVDGPGAAGPYPARGRLDEDMRKWFRY